MELIGRHWYCMMDLKKSRLLVLDADTGMTDSLARLLEAEGFDVFTASGPGEARQLLDSIFFDVVITDLALPDGNGTEILQYCKEYCRKTKIICTTGEASIDSAIEALRCGAHDYVTKPLDLRILLHSIHAMLEKMGMEEEIGLEKERYRALVEDLKDGYFVLEKRQVVYANRALSSMLGCTLSDLGGRPFSSVVHSRTSEKLDLALDAFEASEIGAWHDVLVLLDVKGNEIPVDVKLSIACGSHRRDLLVGLCREITERDVLWDRLVKAEKLALMGEMVAGIAHELNNKLTPILGFVELLKTEVRDERTRQRMHVVHGSALGARRIVESLLAFARKEKPRWKSADVNRIVDSALDIVHPCFSTRGVRVVKHLQPDICPVRVDAVQIEQVLVNLFKNAFEAMGDTGQLTIQTLVVDDSVMIKVTDTGPGIPADIRERIFTPFFTTKESQGKGLGLSICHTIIANHGGNITLHSSRAGTSFVISLPACPDMEASDPVLAPPAFMESGAIKEQKSGLMLVIDDEPEIGKLLTELFRDEFQVEIAENGREALDMLMVTDFDLLVSDVRMPVVDGIELYETLKARFPHYVDRIIYSTGVIFDPDIRAFLEKTGVPYLAKPFKISQLVELVADMMDRQKGEEGGVKRNAA